VKRHPAPQRTEEKKRCAIYTRKSTTIGLEQEFNSLDAQRERCLTYISSRADWQLVEEPYDDGGFTGANIDRPAFQRLLADVEAHRVEIVVVYKVDRLSRSLLDFVKVMERLTAAGGSFVSVTQNFSTADAMGRLTLNMLMSFAEFEREMIAERTRDKICAARRRGKWTGGPVPFGYDLKDKRLYINEPEAAIVREAFDLFLQHREATVVAQILNERGKLPRLSSKPRFLHRWTRGTMSCVLRNPLYTGQVKAGPELRPGEQASIISLETHQAAQALFASPPPRKPEAHVGNPAYILRGLLRCAGCGGFLTPGSTRRHGEEHRYYRCVTRTSKGKEACRARPIHASLLEEHIVECVRGTCRSDPASATGHAFSWIDDVLSNFAKAWPVLAFPNRRNVLRALIDHVVVDTATRRVEMHLRDAAARATEIANEPEAAA
jgi:site-specific DNA recombinase